MYEYLDKDGINGYDTAIDLTPNSDGTFSVWQDFNPCDGWNPVHVEDVWFY
ncbi:hypothetical protein [Pseudarthrobacter sp. H2]|uniref:hypothetical protein n=1 Tax=Pseudarthrobacter sp. H2 TaxID=3418415 RepID=UPI003CE6AC6B